MYDFGPYESDKIDWPVTIGETYYALAVFDADENRVGEDYTTSESRAYRRARTMVKIVGAGAYAEIWWHADTGSTQLDFYDHVAHPTQPDAVIEHLTLVDGWSDNPTCPCGNTVMLDGFGYAEANGTPVPAGEVSDWILCHSCGRYARDHVDTSCEGVENVYLPVVGRWHGPIARNEVGSLA